MLSLKRRLTLSKGAPSFTRGLTLKEEAFLYEEICLKEEAYVYKAETLLWTKIPVEHEGRLSKNVALSLIHDYPFKNAVLKDKFSIITGHPFFY